jgi:hypothetical protein
LPSAHPAARLSARTISRHEVAHQAVAAFWIIAGIIAVVVVGDAFTLLALATVTTAWWVLSAVEHRVERVERNDADMAAAERSN